MSAVATRRDRTSRPFSAPTTPPETGASTSARRIAQPGVGQRRVAAGSMLEKSTTSVLALSWAARPSAANITCSTAAVSDRHRHNLCVGGQLGQGGGVAAPAACSGRFWRVAVQTVSGWPAASRRRHIGRPIRPMPAKAMRRVAHGVWLINGAARPSPGAPQSDHPNPDNQVQTIQGQYRVNQQGLGSTKKLRSSLRISSTSGFVADGRHAGLFDGGQPAFVVLGGHHQMGTEGCMLCWRTYSTGCLPSISGML